MKKLSDLALNITEQEYRDMDAISYSMVAKYEREGFKALETMFEPLRTDSILFGSLVDAMITGTQKEVNEAYYIAPNINLSDAEKCVADKLYEEYGHEFKELSNIEDYNLLRVARFLEYRNTWKDTTVINNIKEKMSGYYASLVESSGKEIVDFEMYQEAVRAVNILRDSPVTQKYFTEKFDTPGVERFYQLKFTTTLTIDIDEIKTDIPIKCMFDAIYVDHNKKIIYPTDLKTTSSKEYEFPASFLHWRYDIQGRIYTWILKEVISNDEYFKDFTIASYAFIVVNRRDPMPLVWEYKDNHTEGEIFMGRKNPNYNHVILKDWKISVSELYLYLKGTYSLPLGIHFLQKNDILEFI